MPCVFISHSSLDREAVEREIIAPLREHGLDIWYSTDNIQTASEWERQIHHGLMTCDWFLVVLTPRAIDSEWVRHEVHWAVMRRKNKIVPVMLEACEPEDMHLGLVQLQYVDFRGGGGRALERLLAVWGLDKGTQVTSLYQAAHDAIAKEDWASAAEKLEEAQRLDPSHLQSRMDLDYVRQQENLASLYEAGRTAVRERRWNDALSTLRRLREAGGDYKDGEELTAFARAELGKEEAELLFSRAVEVAGREEWALAVEQFHAVLNVNPSHAEAQAGLSQALQQKELAELYGAGRSHLEGGRWREALKMFRQVRSIKRNYKGVSELIADADSGLAEEDERRAREEAPETETVGDAKRGAQRGRGQGEGETQYSSGEEGARHRAAVGWAQALGVTGWLNRKTLNWATVVAGVIVLLVFVYLLFFVSYAPESGAPRASNIDTLGQAAELHKNAQALYGQERFVEAEAESRRAVELAPDNDAYRNGLGDALDLQGKSHDAEVEYRKAVELKPDVAEYHNDLGESLYNQRKYAEAEAEYRKATELNPNDGKYHYDLGYALYEQEKYTEAETVSRKATDLAPDNADYHWLLGSNLNQQEKYVEAEAEYRKASGLAPNNANYHNDLGDSLFNQKRYAQAGAEYRKAVELEPDAAEYHYDLGDSLYNQKKYAQAGAEYRKATDLTPDNDDYRNVLGNSLLQQKKYAEAEAEYRKAIELNPNENMFHFNLGLSLSGQKKYAEAEAEYRKAIELNGGVDSYHYSLATNLEYQKKYAEAEAEYRKAIELKPNDARYHVEFALYLHRRNRHKEEADENRLALKIDTGNKAAKQNLLTR